MTESKNLETDYAQQILVYLYQSNESVTTTDILKKVNATGDTMDKALRFLLENGLITDTIKASMPNIRIIALTELGSKVAKEIFRTQIL